MSEKPKIQLFQEQKVRVHWDEDLEKWFFSIIDVVSILTNQIKYQGARNYWKVLKHRLVKEGNETVTNCNRLKMPAADGKMRMTDVADTEQILRLIQTIPSPKAEPFKLWLAKVGHQRIEETENPELSIDRAMANYLKKSYSKEWINQRLKSIEVRKELTDEWQDRGIYEDIDFAILTNVITKAWSDKTVKEYKIFKGLKKENLRDNMSNLELVLNMLAEASTTEISKETKPEGFNENRKVARKGGNVAKKARLEIEKQTGKPVISSKKANLLEEK